MMSEQEDKLIYLQNRIEELEKATINGSAITLCLLPGKNVHEYRSLISSQIAQAANIKDKANRLSVVENLKSAKQAIKDLKKVPPNGLIIFSANCMLQQKHNYEKIVQIIEPHRPITKQVYSCGKSWQFVYIKEEILVNDCLIGFVVIDGNQTLLATLRGSHYEILKVVKSDIMRNHNKGGQSSVRFSRLRDESRYNFVKISCEQTNRQFSVMNEQIEGYIIAGSAGLKHNFIQNASLSPLIRKKVMKVIDIAQGSEEGLKQAINLSKDILVNSKLFKQKQVLNEYFEIVKKSCDKVTNGWSAVVEMIEISLAEKVILCKQMFDRDEIRQIEQVCQRNGCDLQIVSDKSKQGTLFARSYGGIAAILRYEFDSNYLKNIQEIETMETEQNGEFFL